MHAAREVGLVGNARPHTIHASSGGMMFERASQSMMYEYKLYAQTYFQGMRANLWQNLVLRLAGSISKW